MPVGAEENLFKPYPAGQVRPESPLSVLFFGSFLNLQGPEVIVRAAKLYRGAPVRWKLLGEGPQLESCRQLAGDLDTLQFLPWLAYEELPALINSADILLGVFGATDKAARVIPNKVYQALACGKPLITRGAPAYPDHFSGNDNLGIRWVPAGDPAALARTVAELAEDPENLVEIGLQARQTYEDHFSMRTISQALRQALAPIAPDQKDNG